MSMIPRKIYLRENELKEQFMCERMVSCDASIGSCNIEYTNLSQIWHDANEKPHAKKWLLVQLDKDDYKILCLKDLYMDLWCDWCKIFNFIRWAYIDDLLPKGGKK